MAAAKFIKKKFWIPESVELYNSKVSVYHHLEFMFPLGQFNNSIYGVILYQLNPQIFNI